MVNFYKDKIIFTGGTGRFGTVFKKNYHLKNIFYPSKKELNIKCYKSVYKYLKKINPKIIIHAAALSRPMETHNTKPDISIATNIIGTSYLVIAAIRMKIKFIYFSTNYIYPHSTRLNKENDPVLPINNYAISKMGGECAVQMLKNSLILRIAMTERPFVHKKAFTNIKSNFLYYDEVIKIFPKLISLKGIINIGGKTQSIYSFAKNSNPQVQKTKARISKKNLFANPLINTKKLLYLIKSL